MQKVLELFKEALKDIILNKKKYVIKDCMGIDMNGDPLYVYVDLLIDDIVFHCTNDELEYYKYGDINSPIIYKGSLFCWMVIIADFINKKNVGEDFIKFIKGDS